MNKIANVAADVDVAGPSPRRVSVPVIVGGVKVGGGAPIVVQSMTNTDTADVQGTIAQVAALALSRLRTRAHHRGPRRGGRGPSRTSAKVSTGAASRCR